MKLQAILATSLLFAVTQASAGAQEFTALCKRAKDLAPATQVTIESLRKLAGGPFSGKKISCEEAGQILSQKTSIVMSGHTFEYYNVEDLSPIATLDGVRELGLSGQEKVYDLSPLKSLQIESLGIEGTGASKDLSQLRNVENVRDLSISVTSESEIWELLELRSLAKVHLAIWNENNRAPTIDLSPLRSSTSITELTISGGNGRVRGLETIPNLRVLRTTNLALDGKVLASMQLSELSMDRGTLRYPDQLKNMRFVTVLRLQGLGLKDIEMVRGLTKLTVLDVSNNQIERMDPIEGLLELVNLDLSNNKISLEGGLKNLFRLKTLNVSSNLLSYTINISNLINLETLDVSYNHLMILGIRDVVLPKLKEIHMNGNEVRELSTMTAALLPNLEVLELGHNRIFKVDGLENSVSLRTLNIDDNRIQDISLLNRLTNLERLSARSNLLTNPVCPVSKAEVCDFLHQGI